MLTETRHPTGLISVLDSSIRPAYCFAMWTILNSSKQDCSSPSQKSDLGFGRGGLG